jgi:hypothetical protein
MFRFFLAVAGCFILSDGMAQSNLLKMKFYCPAVEGNANTVLHDIAAYSKINIEYSPSSLDSTEKITLPAGETSFGIVLNRILNGQKVSVIEKNNKIIIVAADSPLEAAEKYVIYGFIQLENSLEPLPFASIRETAAGTMCQSNVFGFYSISLPSGKHALQVSFTGSSSRTIIIDLIKNTNLNLALSPAMLPEAQVEAGSMLKRDAGIKLNRYQSGIYSNMLGETDPVRAVYLLPGNMESQESGGKLLVRGGDPGESLFLLDGNQVFNPAHLLGEVSILANTSIKSVQQYKNDFPARLSGGISSVTEINTKDGNMDCWSGEAEAGLNSLSFTLEGPLKKNRTAIMLSSRQSLGDVSNKDLFTYDATFADMHVKATHILNSNNKLQLSGYMGNDRLHLMQDNPEYMQKWSNGLFTVNWNHILGTRSFVNTTFNVSSYNNYIALMYTVPDEYINGIPISQKSTVFNNFSSGNRYEGKTQFELTVSPNLQCRFGGRFEHNIIHAYNTLVTDYFIEDTDSFPSAARTLSFSDIMVYYENEIRIGSNFLIRPGVHFNAYQFEDYSYQAFQPRFFSGYRIDDYQQINLSYTHIGQLLHLVTSPYPGMNREVWIPGSKILKPEESKMLNIGYQYKSRKKLHFTADVYYKETNNVTSFTEKSNILFNNDSIEKKIIAGKGWSYGAELMAEKKYEKWKVLLSYTLSWSWRQYDSLYNGSKQPYRYDRRHNLNLLVQYQPAKKLELSMLWHFNTGDWITLPSTIAFNPDIDPGTGSDPFRGPVTNRLNLNAAYYFNTGRIRHKVMTGLHTVNQSALKYSTEIITTENKNYDITTSPDQLYKFSWYLTYNISF